MSKNHEGGCPCCGCRISFRQFVLLNNFSAINCNTCNARIEILNRKGNAVIAALSGIISATALVLFTYAGEDLFHSTLLGLFIGAITGTLLILIICRVLYKRTQLHQNRNCVPIQYHSKEPITTVAS